MNDRQRWIVCVRCFHTNCLNTQWRARISLIAQQEKQWENPYSCLKPQAFNDEERCIPCKYCPWFLEHVVLAQ